MIQVIFRLQGNWDSQQCRLRTTSILVRDFWNFKLTDRHSYNSKYEIRINTLGFSMSKTAQRRWNSLWFFVTSKINQLLGIPHMTWGRPSGFSCLAPTLASVGPWSFYILGIKIKCSKRKVLYFWMAIQQVGTLKEENGIYYWISFKIVVEIPKGSIHIRRQICFGHFWPTYLPSY